MTDKTELEVTREDRELFILLLGFDAVHSEKDFDRIRKGDFDQWKKMKAIARHRLTTRTPDPTPVAWMPIESAPKDGRSVLVWREGWDEPALARWICCYDYLTDIEIEASGLDDESLGKCDWHAADYLQGCRLENDTTPTHWMPLPPPPAAYRGEA